MVGGLSSQVENAAGFSQRGHVIDSAASEPTAINSKRSSVCINEVTEPPQVAEDFGVLEVASNGDLVVGESFWTVFCKEVEDIFEAVQGRTVMKFDDNSSSSMSDSSPHTGYYNFLLRSTSATRWKKDNYPLPSQMLFLWQIYTENIDPFIKILHRPTMTKVIQEIRTSYDSLDTSMRTLVLAISFAAIMSLEDDEAKATFNTEKDELMARFRLGTEQALEQADILNHPDTTLIQALVIYLSALQHSGETKLAWFLAGLLVRIAVSMNLHLDGSKLDNISPFEVEMRRRLWWQICLIDSRSEYSQVSTFKMSQYMFDTELPTNNNDVNIDPSMTLPPVNIEGWTDVTPFLLRCEICMLSHRLQAMGPAIANINERYELFMRTQSRLRTTYLSHTDDAHRLQSFVVTSVCFFFSKVKLLLPSQRYDLDGVPTGPEPASIFASQMLLVENTFRLQNEVTWKGYRWQLRERHLPWNALRFVLEHLRTEKDWGAFSDRALRTAKTSLETVSQAARNDPRFQQLLLLLAMAQKRAEESHHRGDGSSSADATFPDNSTAEVEANLSVHLAQHKINGEISYGSSQELLLDTTASDGIEMDWQVWDEIAGDLDFWDMNCL